jgi:hypothetical protein
MTTPASIVEHWGTGRAFLLNQQRMHVDVASRQPESGELVVPRSHQPLAPPTMDLPGVLPHRRRWDAPWARGSAHARKCRPDDPVLPASDNFFCIGKDCPRTHTYPVTLADQEGPAMTLIHRPPRPGSIARGAATIIALMAMSAGALTACGSDRSVGATGHAHTADVQVVSAHDTNDQTALRVAMRSLWAQHMEWTYATVVAFAGDSPALQTTLTRLLRNQTDIGDAITPYYGTDAGKTLTDLLRTHIQEAVPVLTAAKAGDQAGLTTAVDAWYANAQNIADFLASANPHWKKREMRQMMAEHITQTIAYASDVLGGNYASAIDKYDQAEAHMLEMADMLTAGLVKQFPDKF